MKYLDPKSVFSIIENHPYITQMFFDNLERIIKDKINEKILEESSKIKELIEKTKKSEYIINALNYYSSKKLMISQKEFDFLCSNLSNNELEKVLKYMDDNGGHYRFVEL